MMRIHWYIILFVFRRGDGWFDESTALGEFNVLSVYTAYWSIKTQVIEVKPLSVMSRMSYSVR